MVRCNALLDSRFLGVKPLPEIGVSVCRAPGAMALVWVDSHSWFSTRRAEGRCHVLRHRDGYDFVLLAVEDPGRYVTDAERVVRLASLDGATDPERSRTTDRVLHLHQVNADRRSNIRAQISPEKA